MATPNGPFQLGTPGIRIAQITDGLSNTLLVGEKHIPQGKLGYGWWDCSSYNGNYFMCSTRAAGENYPLTNNPMDPGWKFGSRHFGIVQFCFADGSVRPVPTNINPFVLGLLADRADDQPIPNY